MGEGRPQSRRPSLASLALADVLADLPDPRSRHGRYHPLPAVLGLVVLGLLLANKSLAATARLGRLSGPPLAHARGGRRGKTPAQATLAELLRALHAPALEAALSRWLRPRLPPPADHIARDGKCLRGRRDGDVPGQHRRAAYAPQVEAVRAQVRVAATTNEHKAALELLGLLPRAGQVIVGDALFGQRDLCAQVQEQGGDDVLIVKDHQEGLATDIGAGCGAAAGARSNAAATDPEAAFSPCGSASPGQPDGQGAWPAGAADLADDHAPDGAAALAGLGARV